MSVSYLEYIWAYHSDLHDIVIMERKNLTLESSRLLQNVLSDENYNTKIILKSTNGLALLRPSYFAEFILIFILTPQLITLFIAYCISSFMTPLGKVRFPLLCPVSQSTCYRKKSKPHSWCIFIMCSMFPLILSFFLSVCVLCFL